jgi:galactose mutarotase-like enzyme
MAEIDFTQPHATYILRDASSNAKLEVVPERGGIVTQWSIQDQDILYLDHERFTHPELSVRGGIPILFPICGNLPGNTYTYQGQSYTLKQHGFARDLPWEVLDASDKTRLTLKLQSNPATLAVYPFKFEVIFTYCLRGSSLDIHQQYTNLGTVPMPFATGLHPYFLVSDKTQLRFEIPATEFWDHRTRSPGQFLGGFDWSLDEIDWAFPKPSGSTATVIDRNRPLQLTLSYDEQYSMLVFWTQQGKNFYCLEPWSAPRNALNTGECLLYVEPDKTLTTQVALSVDFL